MPSRCRFHLPMPRNCILALLLAAPALTFALERDTTFYVQYCRAWTSTGTRNDGARVVTDIMLTSNSVVEVELEVTDTSASVYLFSAGTSYQLSSTGSQWRFNYGGNSATYTANGGEVVKNRRYVVKTSPQGIHVDGELVASRTPLNFTPPNALTLFSQATSNWNRGHLRFFWMKIFEPDGNGELQLVHELRPCMIVGGVMGIYDELSDGVWANSGTTYPNSTTEYNPLGGPLVVPAPNGVGDTVALTNALAAVTRLGANSPESRVLLEPGVYDLAGHYRTTTTHLSLSGSARGLHLAGLGDTPADTILLGEGDAGGRRVIHINSLSISNLTVTGGYLTAADNGGGICATAGSGSVIDCIVSNNYAKGSNGNGGGGIYGAKLVRNCVVAGNRSANGGGLRSCTTVEDCIVTNNTAGDGAGINGCHSYRCYVANNVATYHAGGQKSSTATDCIFVGNSAHVGGNYGNGSGLHSVIATNCVFFGNNDRGSVGSYGTAAASSTLVGCTITNSLGRRSIFDACRLVRCHVADVGARANDGTYSFRVFGRNSGSAIYTNVNCVVENVTLSNAADRVAVASTFVNCTIRNSKGKTNGPLNSDCTAVNTIISGCAPYDVTAATAPIMKNCLYETSSGEFAEGRLTDCIQGKPRYDLSSPVSGYIRHSSPAFNAGFEDDTILALVGDTDLSGRPRRLFGRLDIGAFERQDEIFPGLILGVR